LRPDDRRQKTEDRKQKTGTGNKVIGTMRLQEIQTVIGGVLSGGDAEFSVVSIDTRTLQEKDLFIAIKGPNFNGNAFVGKAGDLKACGAIVSEQVDSTLPTLRVEDCRAALGKLGALNRDRASACVIALTGSQGKTTVKEMTARILAECGEVIMTRGNLNNDLGVPLSLLKIEEKHEFAVIELGANGPGEIAYSVGLTRPQIGHITNIAGTHLEGFGDLEGVARAKAEIWQGIQEGGTAVVNLDDEFAGRFIALIEQQLGGRKLLTVSASGNSDADLLAVDVHLDAISGATFTLQTTAGAITVSLKVAGMHNVRNALSASAMAMAAGAGLEQVKAGLEKFSSVKGRMCIVPGLQQATIIDDSYNASPSSFRAAIDVLVLSRSSTVVVMGDMGELGHDAERAHREVGSYARSCGVDHFIGVGRLSRLAVEAYGDTGIFLEDRELFADTIRPLLNKPVTVLVKGSRSQGMEKLVRQIQAGAKCA
jgi:UDP-N-acetylmuramoyl-tripeptide--D-alanyl-D-alanine ligase